MADSQRGAARPEVDFLLIGAQKSATTSLYRYLGAHPQIYTSVAKETEFFSRADRFERGLDWYLTEYFTDAPTASVTGEASTHYMMYPEVPERIHRHLPDVRLIAVLRNPIDRAYSHYRMMRMRGQEDRPFHSAIQTALRQPTDAPIDERRDYVRLGEYGRILHPFLDRFSRSQLLVVFTEELASQPEATLQRVFQYLNVDHTFVPGSIGNRYNVGGTERATRLVELVRRIAGRVRRNPLLGQVFTESRYAAFKFWTRTELGIRRTEDEGPSPQLRRLLARHFRPDVARLEDLLELEVPWPEL